MRHLLLVPCLLASAACTSQPIAAIDADVLQGRVPLTVHLDGSRSPGGVAWSWDLGDGARADGPQVTHTYLWEGVFEVVLTVEDEAGNVDELSLDVEVARARCPEHLLGEVIGEVEEPALDELSGLVASRRQPGVYWAHNDSGDDPVLYALDETGRALGTFWLDGAEARDWEDLAIGPDGTLYAGDIGDNDEERGHVVVWTAAEPDVSLDGEPVVGEIEARALELAYPDGPHDAETLLVDPVDGRLLIVTKSLEGSLVYAVPGSYDPDARVALERVGQLSFGVGTLPGSPTATGGDVSLHGDRVLLRTYTNAFVWLRDVRDPLHQALTRDPCEVPLTLEPQGESIAWDAAGEAYLTISEGEHPAVWWYGPAE